MLPKSERIRKDLIHLTPEKKTQLEERIGWKFPEEFFEVQKLGYALFPL